MNNDDEGIRAVREVRERISAEFENDPSKLVKHYMMEQEKYRERLLQTVPPEDADGADRPSASR